MAEKGNALVFAALRSLDSCQQISKWTSFEDSKTECHVEQTIVYKRCNALVGFTFHYTQGLHREGEKMVASYENEIFFVQVSAVEWDSKDLLTVIATRLRNLNVIPKEIPIHGIYGSQSLKNLPYGGLSRCNLDFVKFADLLIF
jgi:hypothetical protein